MTVYWTNSRYMISPEHIFQNVLYTINFQPSTQILIPVLTISRTQVLRGMDVTLDASGTFVTNLPLEYNDLTFVWTCPLNFH